MMYGSKTLVCRDMIWDSTWVKKRKVWKCSVMGFSYREKRAVGPMVGKGDSTIRKLYIFITRR
jgi:hypothetical protein